MKVAAAARVYVNPNDDDDDDDNIKLKQVYPNYLIVINHEGDGMVTIAKIIRYCPNKISSEENCFFSTRINIPLSFFIDCSRHELDRPTAKTNDDEYEFIKTPTNDDDDDYDYDDDKNQEDGKDYKNQEKQQQIELIFWSIFLVIMIGLVGFFCWRWNVVMNSDGDIEQQQQSSRQVSDNDSAGNGSNVGGSSMSSVSKSSTENSNSQIPGQLLLLLKERIKATTKTAKIEKLKTIKAIISETESMRNLKSEELSTIKKSDTKIKKLFISILKDKNDNNSCSISSGSDNSKNNIENSTTIKSLNIREKLSKLLAKSLLEQKKKKNKKTMKKERKKQKVPKKKKKEETDEDDESKKKKKNKITERKNQQNNEKKKLIKNNNKKKLIPTSMDSTFNNTTTSLPISHIMNNNQKQQQKQILINSSSATIRTNISSSKLGNNSHKSYSGCYKLFPSIMPSDNSLLIKNNGIFPTSILPSTFSTEISTTKPSTIKIIKTSIIKTTKPSTLTKLESKQQQQVSSLLKQ